MITLPTEINRFSTIKGMLRNTKCSSCRTLIILVVPKHCN